MREVILIMSLSLDRFVAPAEGARDHRSGPEDPALVQRKLDWLSRAGTHAMGRVTYEQMAGHWPSSSHAYARPMNEVPKVVFSKTLREARWDTSEIARGDLAGEVSKLRREPGGDIIAWGGAAFAQGLSGAGLVDEYRLTINPVALGDGLPLFANLSAPIGLRLVEATAYDGGAVLHVYRRA
jgi:dihydrofolate reductase